MNFKYFFILFIAGSEAMLANKPITNNIKPSNHINQINQIKPINPMMGIINHNQSNISCHLCSDIVNIIDAEIHLANGSINIIEEVIRVFCHTLLLPASKKECFYMLDHLNEIVSWLMNGLSPKSICIRLGLCKNTASTSLY